MFTHKLLFTNLQSKPQNSKGKLLGIFVNDISKEIA